MPTLRLLFKDMFFLVNTPIAGGQMRGGVVLLPRRSHTAILVGQSFGFRTLYRTQVNLLNADGYVVWNETTTPASPDLLPDTEEVFERTVALRPGLISSEEERRVGPRVSRELNARIVLSGGVFEALPASREPAQGAKQWRFPGQQPRALTDLLRFTRQADGPHTLLLTYSDGATDRIELGAEDQDIFVWNRDVRDRWPAPELGSLQNHTLKQFRILHELLQLRAGEHREPVGDYPGDRTGDLEASLGPFGPLKIFANSEPICGGEQGECGDDPECEPPPPSSGG